MCNEGVRWREGVEDGGAECGEVVCEGLSCLRGSLDSGDVTCSNIISALCCDVLAWCNILYNWPSRHCEYENRFVRD